MVRGPYEKIDNFRRTGTSHLGVMVAWMQDMEMKCLRRSR